MKTTNSDIRPDTPRNRADYMPLHVSAVTPGEDMRSVLINRIAWGAVFAGVAIILAVQLILNLGGIGVGLATLTPDAAGQWSLADLSPGTVIWSTISGIIATYIGGYAAGRLSGDPTESTTGWHGLTAWAFSLVVLTGLALAGVGTVMGSRLNAAGVDTMGMASRPAIGAPLAGEAQLGTQANAPSAPTAGEAQTAPAPEPNAAAINGALTGNASISPRVAAEAALLTALALVLGAIAAWFGGRAGCIKPTITTDSGTLH